MNRKILFTLLVAGVFTATGCQNTSPTQNNPVFQEQLLSSENVFSGVVPCADCAGIETTLQLAQDGTYILGRTYLEAKSEENTFFETGHWVIKGKKIVLSQQDGKKSYFLMKGENVVMLDINGEPIQSSFNYELDKIKPKKLAGEYSYFADSALFTECGSGKRYDAAENIDLERGYSATGVEGGTPVYVEIEGYYTLRPSMEDGLFDNAVIQTGKIRFDKTSSCHSKK
ncbi:envelope stress response activation lipoprotein NlpE [Xenorhabdus sp. IM139775]|uniref:envelope stress response activation lipoprotein NlpE n=1 Tax=Xenorhabdus sp. IM139775 TaxID=3025876 RepID=UPI00235A1BE3|nr:envelope stress response activation lipoprotein NlpE [Xenorhabdus sp. IM139775]MDC9594946.1 envelope stress response activation lipoprotein NlpE [Xenorhabdus sp. IM139775]